MKINLNEVTEGSSKVTGNSDAVSISAKKEVLTQDTVKYSYFFNVVSAKRFEVSFDIPQNAVNAFVSLNGKKLLGFFSPELPPEAFIPDEAKTEIRSGQDGHPYDTTLAPGRPQMISFKWNQGDELVFYIYYNLPEVLVQR